jgi:hypothetical protein
MLNKDICRQCYFNRYGNDQLSSQTFEFRWSTTSYMLCEQWNGKGTDRTASVLASHLVDITDNPPDDCPYILEQLVHAE